MNLFMFTFTKREQGRNSGFSRRLDWRGTKALKSAPFYEIVDAKVTDSAVEVWLSDGRVPCDFDPVQKFFWKDILRRAERHSQIQDRAHDRHGVAACSRCHMDR
jgi:hypothetical protein